MITRTLKVTEPEAELIRIGLLLAARRFISLGNRVDHDEFDVVAIQPLADRFRARGVDAKQLLDILHLADGLNVIVMEGK